jgi:hypothetical protein
MEMDKELLDGIFLMENYSIVTLWAIHEDMVALKEELEKLKEQAIYLQKLNDAVEAEKQLYFINRNIQMVEEIASIKELDIFEITQYGDFCLN